MLGARIGVSTAENGAVSHARPPWQTFSMAAVKSAS
jgi:hypothetical protein